MNHHQQHWTGNSWLFLWYRTNRVIYRGHYELTVNPAEHFAECLKNAYRVEHFLLWISHFLTKWFRLEIDIQFRLPEKYHVLVFRRVVARKRRVYCVRKRPIYTSPRSWNKQYKTSTKTISTVVLYNISGKTSLKPKILCTLLNLTITNLFGALIMINLFRFN